MALLKKILAFVFALLLTYSLTYILNSRLATVPYLQKKVKGTSAAQLPALGTFFNPISGFWNNAQKPITVFNPQQAIPQLADSVKVIIDNRLVPHIFAKNDKDAYMVQGYLTAQLRLWQMDFLARATSGRVAEVVGSKAIEYDRQQLAQGMVFAAENMLTEMEKYPLAKEMVQAYTDGINSYINNLQPNDYPIEFKLLGYKPEPWTPLKTALLGKRMAANLAGYEEDVEMTNALKLFGVETFQKLYPDQVPEQDPVIPKGTPYNFSPQKGKVQNITAQNYDFLKNIDFQYFTQNLPPKPDPSNGSNNWAVSGKKTKSGKPIVCNDPHLGLSLPAIWFEIQLHTPTLNVYGVSLPGAPGVVIGFNNHVAWAVTNAGTDVRDWYSVQFKDASKNEYMFDNQWLKTKKRIETVYVKDSLPIIDTIVYTHIGPVVYNDPKNPRYNMAFRWKAHDPSFEPLTFYYLNRAKNYNDYEKALQYYDCPAQNFAFASKTDTIALWHNGKFPIKKQGQGKTISDGSKPENHWQGYIPRQQNPHIINPARGFVSSANQHPTDQTYPYYYNGEYEYYRNRRLNFLLDSLKNITPQDLMKVQTDNYNLEASELIPIVLPYIKKHNSLIYKELSNWNFFNETQLTAPIYFEIFEQKLYEWLWDEMKPAANTPPLPLPDKFVSWKLLKMEPNNAFVDLKSTTTITENLDNLIQFICQKTTDSLQNWQAQNPETPLNWANFKATRLMHLARIDAFSQKNIAIGGNKGILNATGSTHGASWRMVVALGDTVQAWGVYPGGQSGAVGSAHYTDFTDTWAKGNYFDLQFLQNTNTQQPTWQTIQFIPQK